ncbi:transient-receptor-potential-like protein [Lytechinus pictus]|uniref:transient-receptor-potential-like protein n=1 Tax=Lytechinus pictus TaxID=7653 RepID=UPI0030BA11D0
MSNHRKTSRVAKPTFKRVALGLVEDITRVKKLFKAIDRGNLIKVQRLLREILANGATLDIRDKAGTNTYAYAISAGVSPAVDILLHYNVPLGDALLRACVASYDEAAKIIIRHAMKLPDKERKAIIECHCDNDDYIKSLTPLKMAAMRNNFNVVSLLLKAGAERIEEPKLERLAEATLKEVVEYLDIYRALSSPAYLCLAHRNALSDAFTLTGRLRNIGRSWEAVNKEFFGLADQVEKFCASLLDHISNSVELSTLLSQSDNPEVIHAVAQVQKAVDFHQKAFVAHAYTQKSLSVNFYRNIDIHSMMFPVLSLLTMFGYPVICLAYILIQHPRLKSFLSTPHIKLCLLFGSDLAFFACCAAICLVNEQRIIDIMMIVIAIFCFAFSWKHVCEIMEYGIRDFVNYSMNIVEIIILIILYTVLMLNWIEDLTDVYEARAQQRHDERMTMVNNVTIASNFNQSDATVTDSLEDYVSSDWNDPFIIRFNLLAFVILFVVIHAFNTVLMTFLELYAIWESTVGAVSDILRFLTIYAIFHFSFALGLSSLHYPQTLIQSEECHDVECDLPEEGYRTFPVALLTLWWAFNGLGDPAIIDDPTSFVNVVYILAVGLYNIGVLVLINTLIAMLGSRFNAVEENSDTEWKFGRTKMWLRFIRTDIDLPPPFNLVPTTGFIIRLFKKCSLFCTGCTHTNQRQSEEKEYKSKKDASAAKKVMKRLVERYNLSQTEKPEEQGESIDIDDIRQLKEDFVAVKFNVQTNLQIVNKAINASWKIIENIKNTYPRMDVFNDKVPFTGSQFGDLYRYDYSLIDVDVENIQTLVKYVEEILNRPDATPELELKKPPVLVQPPPEPSPEPVEEEVILPEELSATSPEPIEEEIIPPESSSDEEEYLYSSLEIISDEEEEVVVPPEEYMDLWARIQRFLGLNEEEINVPEEPLEPNPEINPEEENIPTGEMRPAITANEESTPSEESLNLITRFKRLIGVSSDDVTEEEINPPEMPLQPNPYIIDGDENIPIGERLQASPPNIHGEEPRRTSSEESLNVVTRIQRFIGVGQTTVADEKTNPPEVPPDPSSAIIDDYDNIPVEKRFEESSPNIIGEEPRRTSSEESLDVLTKIQRFIGVGPRTVAEEKTNHPEVPPDPSTVSIDKEYLPDASASPFPGRERSPSIIRRLASIFNSDQTKT